MKIITNANGLVLYAGDNITLTAQQATSEGGSVDKGTTSSNATLIDGVTLPEKYTGAAWTYIKGAWAAVDQSAIEAAFPPPPVPSEVTMRQARLALLGAGLLDSVESALNAMPEKTPEQVAQKKAARIEWEYAQTVQRDKGLTVTLAASLGMKDEQIDALFIAADGIK